MYKTSHLKNIITIIFIIFHSSLAFSKNRYQFNEITPKIKESELERTRKFPKIIFEKSYVEKSIEQMPPQEISKPSQESKVTTQGLDQSKNINWLSNKTLSYNNYKDFKHANYELFQQLEDLYTQDENKQIAKQIGLTTVKLFNEELDKNKLYVANLFYQIGQNMLDIALGLTPVISVVKDTFELLSGKNSVTGMHLSTTERTFAFVGVVTLGLSNYLKAPIMVLSKIFKQINTELIQKGIGTDQRAFGRIINNSTDIVYSARKLGLKTVEGIKVYAKLHNPLKTLPSGLKVKRIKEGADSDKIAIIGRKMPGVVNPTAVHLRKNGIKVEIFSDDIAWEKLRSHQLRYNRSKGLPDNTYLPNNEIIKTNLYKSNKRWAQKLKDEGYTVIDMGNPKDITEMSALYSIEKKILFSE